MGLLKLSTRATYSLALSSGHFVQRDAPRIVSEAVNNMVCDYLAKTEKRIAQSPKANIAKSTGVGTDVRHSSAADRRCPGSA